MRLLQAATLFVATETSKEYEFLFGLNPQLIHDAVLLGVAVFVLFLVMSYLFFNPARDMLKKRQDKIKSDIDGAKKDREDAEALKAEYSEKLNNIKKEAEAILSDARKSAKKTEAEIIAEAKEEAHRIRTRALKEIELEKKHVLDDMKKEMISIASIMAGKVVSANMNTQIQETLIEETLKEIGDNTWQK